MSKFDTRLTSISRPMRDFSQITSRTRTIVLVFAAMFIIALIAPISASAYSWYYGSMGATDGDAGTEAHSLNYVSASADHNNFCVGKEQGTAGYHYSNIFLAAYTCAQTGDGGYTNASLDGSCCWHPDLENYNSFSIFVQGTTAQY